MLDAERLLGSLVRNALGGGGRRRRRGGSFLGMKKSALGLGALGVAIAAFEHLTQGKAVSAPVSSASATATRAPELPPLPPIPGAAATAPPPPPAAGKTEEDALLLVRAMIAAAYADHQLDADERERIEAAIDDAADTEEERAPLLAELERPVDLDTLAAAVTRSDLADQVYLASRIALDVDSPSEEHHLKRLASKLGLSAERVAELDATLTRPGDDG